MQLTNGYKNSIPTLETERLILRGHTANDLPACYEMWSNPLTTKMIGGKPSTEQQTWSRLLNYIGHWSVMGFGYWVMEEKATSAFVGEIGFADFKRALRPPLNGIPEAGWALHPNFYKRGFATEALLEIVQWADQHFECEKTACLIHPSNKSSLKLADRVGYKVAVETTYLGDPTLLHFREKPVR